MHIQDRLELREVFMVGTLNFFLKFYWSISAYRFAIQFHIKQIHSNS